MVGTGYSVINTWGEVQLMTRSNMYSQASLKKGLVKYYCILFYPSPLSLVACVNLQ